MPDPVKETLDEVEVLVRGILEKRFDGSKLEDSTAVIVRMISEMIEEAIKDRLEEARALENKKYRTAVCDSSKKLLARLLLGPFVPKVARDKEAEVK